MTPGARKRIGFLSFGHWQPVPGSRTRTAREALVQTIELAEAQRHSASTGRSSGVTTSRASSRRRSRCCAAIGARTSRIEIGTAVIDMR